VLELCNDTREAVLPVAESRSVLFQLSVDALMAFDGVAHAPNDDYDGKCNQYKQQGSEQVRQIFNVERKAGRQYEERRRSDAKQEAKKACTKPADKRCDYDRRKERDVLNALDIRMDGEPYCQGNRGTRESKGVGPDGSRPQGGDINVD
jgi:hypothetical protein